MQNPSLSASTPDGWQKIACPVCSSESFIFLFTREDEPFVRCAHCSLVLINPRPAPPTTLATYDHDYSEYYIRKARKKMRRSQRRVHRAARLVRGGRWLDVGCSAGLVVKAAADAGFDAYGVDVEEWGVTYARDQLKLTNIRLGTLEDQHYPDGFFSVISVYDVIEHVPDLNLMVSELKRVLAGNGIIDIVTPDVNHWRVPRRLADWNEIKPSEHLYYFNRSTLARLLEKHGLRITRARFHFKPSLHVYAGHVR